MLRVVLAVALATALLGTALPVLEDAGRTAAESKTEGELERVERAAQRLVARNDAVPAGTPGARRTLAVRLPRRSWGSTGLISLHIPPPDEGADPTWRVGDGPVETWSPDVRIVGSDGGLTLRKGGRTDLVLSLRRIDGKPTVLVSRPEFIPEGTATRTHARTQGDAN